MDEHLNRRAVNASGIFSLWWNWTLAVGLLTAVIVMSVVIPKLWIPFVTFAFHVGLLVIIRRRRASARRVCDLMLMVASHALLWSAIVMVLINTLHTRWLSGLLSDPGLYNKEIPFITVLVVAPVTMIVSLLVKLSGKDRSFCADCYFRNGSRYERGFLGTLFSREAHYQLNVLLGLATVTSVYGWAYYFLFYINVNINTPDQFVFRWVPLMLYAVSLGYFGMRYISLWGYYRKVVEANLDRHGDSTLLRFLLMWGDYIYLHDPASAEAADGRVSDPDGDRVDTPARMYVSRRLDMSDHEARGYLASISGLKDPNVRFMYTSPNFNVDCNIFHYACFIDKSEDMDKSSLSGSWFTLDQIKRLDGSGRLSPFLSSEIARLYRVAMAWKTYDREGRRLYAIKHYRPTFRLRDFKNWDVDIDDPVWLFVSDNNEDRPFYRLKRMWRRYVSGIGK